MKLNLERIDFMIQTVLETKDLTAEDVGPMGMFHIKSQVTQMEIWHARYNDAHGIVEVEMDPTLFETGEPSDG